MFNRYKFLKISSVDSRYLRFRHIVPYKPSRLLLLENYPSKELTEFLVAYGNTPVMERIFHEISRMSLKVSRDYHIVIRLSKKRIIITTNLYS